MGPEEVVEGTVRAVTVHGVFVDFEDGATGLLHVKQMSKGIAESRDAVFLVNGRKKARGGAIIPPCIGLISLLNLPPYLRLHVYRWGTL